MDLTPIVIGVGDIVNRSQHLEDSREPADLIERAIRNALNDAGLEDLTSSAALYEIVDSISIVRSWTWPYPDLPGLLSSRLGIDPERREYTENGGDKPAKIFDQAARRIARGESKFAIIAGGEALASLNAFAIADKLPPPKWTPIDEEVDKVFSPTTAARASDRGIAGPHKIGPPIQIYPLYENGLRAHIGQSIRENHRESAQMYSSFSKVAQHNEFAWNHGKFEDAESIGRVHEQNRMICFPYPLHMNAFNTVNLAAACILTSTELASELGVPKHKWIYPLGGAGSQDSNFFWERPNFHSSPAIERSIDTALELSGLTKGDVDCFDVYSCFPVVPKLVCHHLELSVTRPEKPITLLGGLTSFGGAGNNYSMHALTAMVRGLRKGTYRNGLVLANGGVVTYEYAVCLSRSPPKQSYPVTDPLPKVIDDISIPKVDESPEGEAIIETYTVDYDRQNKPIRGHIVGRLKSGNNARFLANHGDESTLQQLASWTREPIGREGIVKPDKENPGRNLFSFSERGGKL